MLKDLLSFLLILLSISIQAQMSHGFEVGANLMNASFTLDGAEVSTEYAWGPRAGYVGEFELWPSSYLRGALLFMQKGFRFAEETWALNSFDLPINLGYAVDIKGERLQWFVDGGLSMEYYTRAVSRINDEPVELLMGRDEGEVKRIGSGFNLGTGIQFSRMLKLRINYYRGLTNLINTQGPDKWQNQYIGLSLNFLFRKHNI